MGKFNLILRWDFLLPHTTFFASDDADARMDTEMSRLQFFLLKSMNDCCRTLEQTISDCDLLRYTKGRHNGKNNFIDVSDRIDGVVASVLFCVFYGVKKNYSLVRCIITLKLYVLVMKLW